MNKALENLIGKVCSVEINNNCNVVTVKGISGNWLEVTDNGENAYINLNLVSEIKEIGDKSATRRTMYGI